MPRPLRPALIHGTYHITAHGVNEEDVFRADSDRRFYLFLLKKHAARGGVRVLAYVLMSNHVHLVVSTADTNLSSLIQRVHGIYGAWFNRQYGRRGHLFGSRFYSDAVSTDAHLLASTRYVHRNPVRAHMVERPEEYAWSSYRAYVGVEPDGLVDPLPVLQCFATERSAAATAYESFVLERTDLAGLLQSINSGQRSTRDLVMAAADLLNLVPTAVDHRTRGSPARRLTCMLLQRVLGWTPHRIASEMGMEYAGVVSALKEDNHRGERHENERARFKEILALLDGAPQAVGSKTGHV